MKNILIEIVRHKREEVQRMKEIFPISGFSEVYKKERYSLQHALLNVQGAGILAEFKRKSPSVGLFNAGADVVSVTTGYVAAGAVAVSVLTDAHFFGGSLDDLKAARSAVTCPILRKDFIIDEYQVMESKQAGADAILLIAGLLPPEQIVRLTRIAHEAGLEVVLEIHNEDELLANRAAPVDVVGVNNRNLKTFEVTIGTSVHLAGLLPGKVARISESGLENPIELAGLRRLGYHGFLIGQRFMRHPHPAEACKEFIRQVNQFLDSKANA